MASLSGTLLYLIVFLSNDVFGLKKTRFLIGVAAIILLILSSVDGMWFDVIGRAIFRFSLYFLVSVILLQKFSRVGSQVTVYALIVPYALLFVPSLIFFSEAIFKPIDVAPLLVLPCIYLLSRMDRPRFMLGIAPLIALVVIYSGYTTFLYALSGTRYESTASAVADYRSTLALASSDGDTFTLSRYKGKIVVVDIWYTGCALCYDKFPGFKALANSYRQQSDVVFAMLNLPLAGEPRSPDALAKTLKYQLAQFVALDSPAIEKWDVPYFPIIMIFDKNGTLRYKGANNTGVNALVNNVPHIINELERE